MTGRFLTQPRGRVSRRLLPWYRKRHYQVALVAVVVGAAVLTDRYVRYDPVQQQNALSSMAAAARSDLQFCNDGVALAAHRWHTFGADPSAAARSALHDLAAEAEPSCTPVGSDGGVLALAGLRPPGALPDPPRVAKALTSLTEWAYPEAARYLLALESLARRPTDAAAKAELARAASGMRRQEHAAAVALAAEARQLAMRPPPMPLASP